MNDTQWVEFKDGRDVKAMREAHIVEWFTGGRRSGTDRRTEYRGTERRQQGERRDMLHGVA